MKNNIQHTLENSLSYQEYREHVANLLSQGKSTGDNQTDKRRRIRKETFKVDSQNE